jgi:hypothetical protein
VEKSDARFVEEIVQNPATIPVRGENPLFMFALQSERNPQQLLQLH